MCQAVGEGIESGLLQNPIQMIGWAQLAHAGAVLPVCPCNLSFSL